MWKGRKGRWQTGTTRNGEHVRWSGSVRVDRKAETVAEGSRPEVGGSLPTTYERGCRGIRSLLDVRVDVLGRPRGMGNGGAGWKKRTKWVENVPIEVRMAHARLVRRTWMMTSLRDMLEWTTDAKLNLEATALFRSPPTSHGTPSKVYFLMCGEMLLCTYIMAAWASRRFVKHEVLRKYRNDRGWANTGSVLLANLTCTQLRSTYIHALLCSYSCRSRRCNCCHQRNFGSATFVEHAIIETLSFGTCLARRPAGRRKKQVVPRCGCVDMPGVWGREKVTIAADLLHPSSCSPATDGLQPGLGSELISTPTRE